MFAVLGLGLMYNILSIGWTCLTVWDRLSWRSWDRLSWRSWDGLSWRYGMDLFGGAGSTFVAGVGSTFVAGVDVFIQQVLTQYGQRNTHVPSYLFFGGRTEEQ